VDPQVPRPLLAIHALFPTLWLLLAGRAAMAPFSVDLCGHLWVYWNATHGPSTRTAYLLHPDGVDLLPYLGGWTDIAIASIVTPVAGIGLAFNVVMAIYLLAAGVGGHALARALGTTHRSAAFAGLLLQCDGFVLFHLHGGRAEQVGIGFVALSIAAALRAWRSTNVRWAVAAGALGALTVYVSWQQAVFLAGCMAFLLPFVLWGGGPPGAIRRWVTAAGLTAALAGPWAGVFLMRAVTSGKFADEAGQSIGFSNWGSFGVLGWLEPTAVHTSYLAMLAMLTVPWTARRRDRRVLLGVALGCLFAISLSWGPHPAWFGPGNPASGSWGPFRLMQAIPVLGGFVWPDRFLAALSLATPPAVALLMDRVGAWSRRHGMPASLAFALGGLVLVGSLAEAWYNDRIPSRGFELVETPELQLLAGMSADGAVLDLPRPRTAARAVQYQNDQMVHGRPLLFLMPLHAATDRAVDQRVRQDPVLGWFATLRGKAPPADVTFGPDDLHSLRTQGFGFLVLHGDDLPPTRHALARAVLTRSLGEPSIARPDGSWLAWKL
jgi:hypothetical protein